MKGSRDRETKGSGAPDPLPLADIWMCQDCGKCTAVCPVARTGLGFSPRRLLQQAIVSGADIAGSSGQPPSRAIFTCLACDRCQPVCMSGISISGIVLRLRTVAYERGLAGEPAHAGIVQTLARIMAQSDKPMNRLAWLDPGIRCPESGAAPEAPASDSGLPEGFPALGAPGIRVSAEGDVLYFVGCAPFFEALFGHLGVSPLRTTRNAIRLLNHVGIEPVLLPDERCCGHDLLWQGNRADFEQLARRNLEMIRGTGVKTVVFSCPEGLVTFKRDYPRLFGSLGFESIHIIELLARRLVRTGATGRTVATFHDPCRLGRQLGIYDPPRELLRSVAGLEFVEMPHARESATCCGGTCWMECGAGVKALQNQRLAEARSTGADWLVTACPKCDIHLSCAIAGTEYHGPAVTNIVDLLAQSLGLPETPESQAGTAAKGGPSRASAGSVQEGGESNG